MTDLTIFGKPARFVRHSGKSRLRAVDLPSSSRVSHRPTLQIQELVAVSYGFHPDCMTVPDKRQPVAFVRQIAMYLTRELTHRSLPMIGQAFKRDHSTVIHGIEVVKRRMAEDPLVAADVDALKAALTK